MRMILKSAIASLAWTGLVAIVLTPAFGQEHPVTPPDDGGVTLASSGPLSLGAGPVRATLRPANPGALAAAVRKLTPDQHVFVVLRDLHAEQPPSILYRLYLELPAGAKGAAA